MRGRQEGVVHVQAAQARGLAESRLPALFAHGIFDAPRDANSGGGVVGIADRVPQNRHGPPGGVNIQGHERIESFQPDFHRQLGIAKGDARERVRARKGGFGKTRQTRSVIGAEAAGVPFVGRLEARFQHARHGFALSHLGPNCREGVTQLVSLVGPVEDFPIAELPAATE